MSTKLEQQHKLNSPHFSIDFGEFFSKFGL